MSNLYSIFSKHFWTIFFSFILFFSSGVIISALIIDKILGFDPCELCYYERIPYLVMAIISFVNLFINQKYRGLLLQVLFLAALIGGGIAIYHTGMEKEWWNPSVRCKPPIYFDQAANFEDFKKMLEAMPIGDCSKPAIKLFGFSLAELNVIINLLLAAVLVQLIKLNAKTKIQKR